MARQKSARATAVGGGGPGRPGGAARWAELTSALEPFSTTARGTEIIIGQLVAFLRRARLEPRRSNAGEHAALDVLAALRWSMASDKKELRRLQNEAHKILTRHDPGALVLNKATFRTPADLGRGLKSALESYISDLSAGASHDIEAFADRIARWLVRADARVRLLDDPTIEGVRTALVGERELRHFDPRAKVDRLAALVLRAAGVPPKKAWNAVNAAEGMKQSRKSRREQTTPSAAELPLTRRAR